MMKISIGRKFKEYLISNQYKKIHMIRSKDMCISIFSKQEWNSQKDKFESMFSGEERRIMSKRFFSNKDIRVDLESNGYNVIEISDEFQKWANIDSGVVIIALSNRIEVWSAEYYDLYCKNRNAIVLEKLSHYSR